MRVRGIILAITVLLIVAAVFAWRIFNPRPMAFAGIFRLTKLHDATGHFGAVNILRCHHASTER
jgi:hypothetical protein